MHKARRTSEVLLLLTANWAVVLVGMGLVATTTTLFYFVTIYTPTFGTQALHLASRDVLIVTVCVGLSNFAWLPVGGALSDRFGRLPLLTAVPILAIVTAYPIMAWLADGPTFGKLLATELLFSAYFGLYNGAMIPYLSEIVPPQIRTAGFSLAYSLATALFGGITPLVSDTIIHMTGNAALPSLWLGFACVVSLVAVLASRGVAADDGGARRHGRAAEARPFGVAAAARREPLVSACDARPVLTRSGDVTGSRSASVDHVAHAESDLLGRQVARGRGRGRERHGGNGRDRGNGSRCRAGVWGATAKDTPAMAAQAKL